MLKSFIKNNVVYQRTCTFQIWRRNFNKTSINQPNVQSGKSPIARRPKIVFCLDNLESRRFSTELSNDRNKDNLFSKNKQLTALDLIFQSQNTPNGPKKELEEEHDIHKLFPSPKNVLHNAFDVLTKELKDDKLKLHPSYTVTREKNNRYNWVCSYNLKWPEITKITGNGKTKQEASHRAAVAALLWLRRKEKLTKEGQPIIVDKEDVKDLKHKSIEILKLDGFSNSKIRDIIREHDEIKGLINFENLQEVENLKAVEVESSFNVAPRNFQPFQYLAKEKVVLPISSYKEEFINTLKNNNVVIVKGEPGCGKSTRIPQYVLESWIREEEREENCRIAVTQPRRIATISLAETVAEERDEQVGKIVGYQVRLKSKFNPATGKILYCTTGILLRHLQSDPELKNFSHIILDEAHERDVNTDLLINLLKSTQELNPNLKLIIMSATMDTELFQNYFTSAATIHVPGFTYPVEDHFLDDLDLNLSKTLRMLDFPTPSVVHEDVVRIIKHIHKTKREGAILCFLPGWDDISRVRKLLPPSRDLFVHCLHSRLQDSEQHQIFSKPPPGIRKVILATNIAETSVTINDVVYVVDTGIHKENRYDVERGVNCMDNHWISKSSMKQRKGRAGRVQPGESFHLYTREKSEGFPEFTIPEMLRVSLTKIVLNSKVYSNNMNAFEFMMRLPNPPEEQAINRAVAELQDLELLDEDENLTPLGRTLTNFQLEPKFAKALVNSVVFKCVTPIVDIITLFSSSIELFVSGLYNKEQTKNVKSKFSPNSDHLALMRLFEDWLECQEDRDISEAQKICARYNLVPHKLFTVQQLRKLHFDYLHDGLSKCIPIADDLSNNDEVVKAVLLSGVGTLLQHRNWDIVKGRLKYCDVFITSKNHKATITSESVNYKKRKFDSNFFVYLNEIRSNLRRTTLVRESSMISPLAVVLFLNKPLIVKNAETTDENQVKLCLKGTKIEFLCDKSQVDDIVKCKEALRSLYQYYINQLTKNTETNEVILEKWNQILDDLNELLEKNSV